MLKYLERLFHYFRLKVKLPSMLLILSTYLNKIFTTILRFLTDQVYWVRLSSKSFQKAKANKATDVTFVLSKTSTYFTVLGRCLMGSTDQADPSCFYFRIS